MAAAAAGGLLVVNPNSVHVPLCPLHAMTGLWCPFCGTTRATYALLHGDLTVAVRDNVVFLAALPLLAAVLVARVLGAPQRSAPRSARWLAVAALLGFALLRNLAIGSWLTPPG
jgi:Protein of unknown function (DUF2752)